MTNEDIVKDLRTLIAKIEGSTQSTHDQLWMTVANAEVGQKEIVGGQDNPRIVEYHQATTLKADDDETAWCSSFVCWCLAKAGYASTKSAWAQSFANYGTKLDGPKKGCIVVFKWSSSSGHVGFCEDFDADTVMVLGGNQSNAVNHKEFSRGPSIIGYRWPVPSTT
jgi:uncharacterized protein (TIGR02594 family)